MTILSTQDVVGTPFGGVFVDEGAGTVDVGFGVYVNAAPGYATAMASPALLRARLHADAPRGLPAVQSYARRRQYSFGHVIAAPHTASMARAVLRVRRARPISQAQHMHALRPNPPAPPPIVVASAEYLYFARHRNRR